MIMIKKIAQLFMFLCLALAMQSSFARDVSLEKNQIVLTLNHGGDGSAWGLSECSGCHVLRNIHGNAPKIKGIVQQTGYASCAGCHGQNGTTIKRECVLCHNESLLPKKPLMQDVKNHNFKMQEDSILNDKDCLACHYASDMDGDFEPAVDLKDYDLKGALDLPYRNGSEFCLRCHNKNHQQAGYEIQVRFKRDPLVMMAINYEHIDMHGKRLGEGNRTYTGLREAYEYQITVACSDCHAMHGTHNEKLIVDRSDAGMSLLKDSLRSVPISIDTPGNNYAQLCVTCHDSEEVVEESELQTGNGLSGVHQASGSCVECHVHGMAAQTGL
jgi:hypothetical protein